MDWFQHKTDSKEDPDIMEAEDLFGDAGYTVFFKTLEVYGREYNSVDSGGNLRISQTILARKLRKRWTKVELILNFYQTKQRIYLTSDPEYKNFILINIPKFNKIASNWTKRIKGLPTEEPTEEPTAKEKEEEKEKKKNNMLPKNGNGSKSYFPSDSIQFILAKRLHDLISYRHENYKFPDLQKEAYTIDLMIRLGTKHINKGISTERIKKVIDWCQADDGDGRWAGWQDNIRSVGKLRDKFMRLESDMKKEQGGNVRQFTGRTMKNAMEADEWIKNSS